MPEVKIAAVAVNEGSGVALASFMRSEDRNGVNRPSLAQVTAQPDGQPKSQV